MSSEHTERRRKPRATPSRGFENEPADEWREEHGRGGPVRSNEPERDYFFEHGASEEREVEKEIATLPALKPMHFQRESYRGQGPSNYRPTDERIRERLCEVLTDHGDIDASSFALEVDCGIVKLEGNVRDEAMKDRLLATVQDIHGVVGVVDRLDVVTRDP
jgi:hypothetical protein